jgi:ribose transport system permease protein
MSLATDDARLGSPGWRGLVGAPQFALLVIIGVLCAIFALRSPGFLSSFNLFAMGRSLAVDVVIGFGQMVVLATGGMNLSIGSIGVCAVMLAGYCMQVLGLPVTVAFALAVLLGGALGWLNGFTIVRSGVNSFVVTLGSANLFSGAMLILTKAQPLNALPPEVSAIGKYRLFGVASPSLVVAAVLGALLFVFFRYAVSGRRVLASGANARAASMSGVPVDRMIVLSHIMSGVLAAVAGLMVVVRVGAAMPAVGGEDWLLPSFLGPVLGGTALAGGLVSVVGAMLGAALVTIIRSGLLVLDIGNFWLQLFLGLFLLAAVLAQRYGGALSAGAAS